MRQTQLIAPFIFFIIVLLLPEFAAAQEADGDDQRFFMLNQHQCYGQYMDEVQAHFDDEVAPVLDDLVDEGHIIEWGALQHLWGDEWNWNFYIVAESHSAFLDAWSEFGQRVGSPYEGSDFGEWCHAHRDNMYTLTNWGQ